MKITMVKALDNNMHGNMREILTSYVVMFVVVLITFLGVRACTNHPVVYISNATGECVSVESTDSAHSCRNKPDTYDVAWVK